MAEPAAAPVVVAAGAAAPAQRRAPAWLFAPLAIPFGVAGSFCAVDLNFILNKYHVDPAKADSATSMEGTISVSTDHGICPAPARRLHLLWGWLHSVFCLPRVRA